MPNGLFDHVKYFPDFWYLPPPVMNAAYCITLTLHLSPCLSILIVPCLPPSSLLKFSSSFTLSPPWLSVLRECWIRTLVELSDMWLEYCSNVYKYFVCAKLYYSFFHLQMEYLQHSSFGGCYRKEIFTLWFLAVFLSERDREIKEKLKLRGDDYK